MSILGILSDYSFSIPARAMTCPRISWLFWLNYISHVIRVTPIGILFVGKPNYIKYSQTPLNETHIFMIL